MEHSGLHIALYGASGALGEQILIALESAGLSVASMTLVGMEGTAGNRIPWKGASVSVVTPDKVPIETLDAAIIAIPEESAAALREQLVKAGVFVIDASSGAVENELPLVWPMLQTDTLEDHSGAVALPCGISSTIAPLLAPFSARNELERVDVVALLGASADGKRAEKDFATQTFALLNSKLPASGALDGILSFNVLSRLPERNDASRADAETLALLGNHECEIHTQVLQIPVFTGITCSVTLRFKKPTDLEAAGSELRGAKERAHVAASGTGLRDALDRDQVTLTGVTMPNDRTLRVIIFADPLHRIGQAAVKILCQVAEEDLW